MKSARPLRATSRLSRPAPELSAKAETGYQLAIVLQPAAALVTCTWPRKVDTKQLPAGLRSLRGMATPHHVDTIIVEVEDKAGER